MSLYFLPSLLALAIKLLILYYAAKGKRVSSAFVSLVLVFACHNAIELIGYLRFLSDQTVAALFRGYYAATIALLLSLLVHALVTAKVHQRKLLSAIIFAGSSLLALAVIFTDTVIAGSYSIGYALTAIKGPYYSVFMLYALLMLLATGFILWRNFVQSDTAMGSLKSVYTMFALLPLLFVCLLGIAFKLLDAPVNVAGLIPIATTLFLFIIIKSESSHRLTDLRRFLPNSRERKASLEFMRLIDNYAQQAEGVDSYSELRRGFERQVILYTLEKNNNNITKAAEMMGLPNRSTLYSMMKRLDIGAADRP